MAEVGDRIQVPSKKVGQQPREGVVTGTSGTLLRVTWSTGEESTITPAVGSLVVIGRVRAGSKRTTVTTRAGQKSSGVKKAAKATVKKAAKSAKSASGASRSTKSKSGAARAKRRR